MSPALASSPRLKRAFFRDDPRTTAKRLLGHSLVRILDDGTRLSGLIVETEAYLGVRDRAAHTFGGRRTSRNEAMYADGGTAYIYFTYGMHHCFNIVCGHIDEPVAVLIRALEPLEGLDTMQQNRATDPCSEAVRSPKADRLAHSRLTSGPARLCKALAIDRALNRADLTESEHLWIERGRSIRPCDIAAGPRIGVDYAGAWASRHLRFWVKGNRNVSR